MKKVDKYIAVFDGDASNDGVLVKDEKYIIETSLTGNVSVYDMQNNYLKENRIDNFSRYERLN